MSQITITDEAILAQLDSGNGTITVRDGDGKVRGFFTPIQAADLEPRISEEELRRREEDKTCKLYTTEEVIAKLRSL
jgi:hypothetical protein